jgi:hypothetical protein
MLEPRIEVFENVASPTLFAAAWATCMGANWRFGHGSIAGGSARFWRMDLAEDAALTAIWESVRPRCEALAGFPLRVVEQYANGHTYGQGGNAHRDDQRDDTFTFLYYPVPEWEEEWDGETVFYGDDGEILRSIRLRPNRAVFFDSRIWHRGRGPSRSCPFLRVSVAYKLERYSGGIATATATLRPEPVPVLEANSSSQVVCETHREGATRIYTAGADEEQIDSMVRQCLDAIGSSVSLPGFRDGKAPRAVLEQRYGAQARGDALKKLAARIVESQLPEGSVAGACELVSGAESGPMEIRIFATHLPDLPTPDLSRPPLEQIAITDPPPKQAAFVQAHLKSQVLDRVDTACPLPLFPGIVDREFSALWKSAESVGALPEGREDRAACAGQLREIASRRLRLGLVIVELARRFGISGTDGAALEAQTVAYLLSRATVADRAPTAEELAQMEEG